MTELAAYRPADLAVNGTGHRTPDPPPGTKLIAWAQSLSAADSIATALCETSFVPKHFYRKPAEAAAALMLGEELGLSPVSALRSIYIIAGTPSLYAKSMVALVQSAGHQVWTEHDTPDKVTVCGQRRGSTHVEKSEWTTARARKAGYTNNRKYETDPQAMLYARASSDVCRKIAADVLAGVPYTVEEMELETTPAPVKKVQRAKAIAPPPPEPDLEDTPPPPAPAAVIEPDADGITPAQVKKMATVMGKLGFDRERALQYVADVIERTVETRNDLTKSEANLVIDALEREETPEAPEPDLDGSQ